ncbi:caspase family protein [Agromyces sp. NPDC004153]
MPPRHHVLLIGIDAYDGGGMLTGCVNDIDVVQRLLIDRVGVPAAHIRRLTAPRFGSPHETDVPEESPVLDTIRAALWELGTDAVAPEDRVFIYYSGHGTQSLLSRDGGPRFAREALLPKDKKQGTEYRLLYDWELNALIARIAARSAAVTVILDCCNSGGATRSLDEGSTTGTDRFWPTPELTLPAGTEPPAGSVRGIVPAVTSLQQCQVVAACRDDQRARESGTAGGMTNGELSRALLANLSALSHTELQDLRWGRIWRGIEADVREANALQTPWLFGRFGRRVFGFGPDDETDPGYAVVQIPAGYRIDAGSLAGVTVDAEIGVYGEGPPAFPPLGTDDDLAARKGTIRVVKSERATSEAVAVEPFVLPAAPRGRLIGSGRGAELQVALDPLDADLAAQLDASPLIEMVEPDRAELTLVRRIDGDWALVDDVHGTGDNADDPLLATIPVDRIGLARSAVEHYQAYSAPLRMARACRDLPSLLRLWLLDCGDASFAGDAAQDPDLPQVQPGEHAPYEVEIGDRICIAVENAADVSLSVALFDCAASGRVLLLGEKVIPRQARHVFWLDDTLGEPFSAGLPEDRSVGVDRIAAIATTRRDVSLRYLERRQSFDEIIHPLRDRAALRDLGGERRSDAPPTDSWTSALTALRIVGPGAFGR